MASKAISDRAFFVVVEGLDGTGKSSIARKLAKLLNESDCLPGAVKMTFEPYDPSACGLYIRQALQHRITVPRPILAMAFAVNRADHCNRDIEPFLKQANGRGRVVICDRYYLSSLVYQAGEDLTFDQIMQMNDLARRPDLTIFLSASDKTCYSRMKSRQQPRELFETNLRATRAKYHEAIEYLKKRGEQVLEVPADGNPNQVFLSVLNALIQAAPQWLRHRIQPRLLIDEEPSVYEETNITIASCAETLKPNWERGMLFDLDDLVGRIQSVKKAARTCVAKLSYSDLAGLFLNIVESLGYKCVGRLPWTDVDAVELSYAMPLGVCQRGAALFMGDTQRYDAVLPNVLGDEKVATLRGVCDFLLILDSNPSALHSKNYERDHIRYPSGLDTSPSIAVLGRDNLAAALVEHSIKAIFAEYNQTIRGLPGCTDFIAAEMRTANSQASPSPLTA